jgi:hypothetical protein
MPKYASVYERKDSPYIWIAYHCPKRRKRVGEATPFRKDEHGARRKALALATEKSQETRIDREERSTDFEAWVPTWLQLHHRQSPKSLKAESGRWEQLHGYLYEKGIPSPRHVTYDNAIGYLKWRQDQVKRSGKKPGYNTALQELRFLGRLLKEAVRRGYCIANPLASMGLKKDPPKEKPEITDAEVSLIRRKLKDEPEWMRVSFEIATYQGCRLSETQVPFSRINFEAGTIQFHVKRGKVFTTRLHPKLVPLLTKLKSRGLKQTCTLPQMAAKDWHWFFHGRDEPGHHRPAFLPHLCFHCTRVTVITKMARAGVPMAQAMAYVGHANSLIHRIYQRLLPADVGSAVAAIDV